MWHYRLGHLHYQGLHILSRKGKAIGLPSIHVIKHICSNCMLGKQHLEPILKHNNTREKEVNELIHSDLCGPLPHASLSRSRYFLTFINDFSQKNWTYFLKVKNEAFEKFKVFKRMIENHGRKRIKILRTNKGGEFLSKESIAFHEQSGIQKQLTTSYTPHQNGVAKRKNITILEKTKNMAIESNCP